MSKKDLEYRVFSDTGIEFSEDGELETKSFELLTTAKQTDPRYGDFSYSKEQLEEMAKDFNEGLLGREVAVDLNHDMQGKAYAWIQPGSMQVAPSHKLSGEYSIFARLYRYTPEGKELVKTGAYRYFSLAIRPKMERFIGGVKKTLKNVIIGLALTNSPVYKDMIPTFSENFYSSINPKNMETFKLVLSELTAKAVVSKPEKDLLSKMVKTLSEEEQTEVAAEVATVEAKPEQTEEEVAAKAAADKAEADAKAEAEKNLSEADRKFAEQARELSELKEKVRAKEVAEQISEVSLSEKVTTGFGAEQLSAAQAFMMSLSDDQRGEFVSLVKQIKTVELGEKGKSGTPKAASDNDGDEGMNPEAMKVAKEKGITYGQALKQVTKK